MKTLKSTKSRIIAAIVAAILALLGINSCTTLRRTMPDVVSYNCTEHDSCTVINLTIHNRTTLINK